MFPVIIFKKRPIILTVFISNIQSTVVTEFSLFPLILEVLGGEEI
jgi:hypothetical protein